MKALVPILLLCSSLIAMAQTQVGQSITGDTNTDSFGDSVDISSNGMIVVIGSGSSESAGMVTNGLVRVYEFNGTQWMQRGNDIYGDTNEAGFGSTVAISANGNRIVTGARADSENGDHTGKVRVFEFNNGQWVQLGSSLFGENTGDQFGQVVDMSDDGSRIAVSSPLSDDDGTDGGAIKVYEFNGTNWIQLGENILGETPNDRLGLSSISFSSDGNTVAASSDSNNQGGTNSGNVLVHEYDGTEWIQVGSDIDGAESQDGNRGIFVALSGDATRLAMGVPGNRDVGSDAGHVRVFELINGEWEQLGSDLFGDEAFDFYGQAVSLSENGEYLSVCSNTADGNQSAGETNIYQYTNGAWIEVADITGDGSGYKAMGFNANADHIVIGNDIGNGGQVRIFSLSDILSYTDQPFSTSPILYPNPTERFLNIDTNSTIEDIIMYSSLGIKIPINWNSNIIDLANLSNGIYFIKLKTQLGNITKKVIVNTK